MFKCNRLNKTVWEGVHSHCVSMKYIVCWQRLICPVITVGVFKQNKLLSVDFSKDRWRIKRSTRRGSLVQQQTKISAGTFDLKK